MIINAQSWSREAFKDNAKMTQQVSQILADIRIEGESAINRYSMSFDQQPAKVIDLKNFDEYQLKPDLADAIKFSAKRIERFAHFQMQGVCTRSFDDEYGRFSQQVTPIERVGAYIPGGRFPLISTALMTLIPAKAAGSRVRIACSPSDNPAILAAASLAGATQFIQLGGVQAIGALAYGIGATQPVDIIVGPGNAWVNEAKKQVQSRVKIDGLAGPSELLAICDATQPVKLIALDALAQAEHDPLASSLILSDNLEWLQSLQVYLEEKEETRKLLINKQIQLIKADAPAELIKFSNRFAPEHLMLCHQDIQQNALTHYGSLFIGIDSAVALGDYISGPNHTLPTLGYARQSGGLSVNNFLKISTIQEINAQGKNILSSIALPLAKEEGLEYHFQSLKARCQN